MVGVMCYQWSVTELCPVQFFMNDLENTDTMLTESGDHAKLGRTKKKFEDKSGFKTDRVE